MFQHLVGAQNILPPLSQQPSDGLAKPLGYRPIIAVRIARKLPMQLLQ